MSAEWYLYKDGTQRGPFTWEQLRQKAASGGIGPQDQVWSETLGDWTPADEVEGLLYAHAAPAPAPWSTAAPPAPSPAERRAAPAADAAWAAPRQTGIYPKAPLGRRFFAYLIDGFISSIPMSVIGIVIAVAFALTADSYGDPPALVMVIAVGGGLLAFGWAFLYTLLRDGFGQGQSWGKKMVKLMVVGLEDGQPCTKKKSAVRNLISGVLGFIDIIVALFQQQGQRVGDMLAKTQVIEVQAYGRGRY